MAPPPCLSMGGISFCIHIHTPFRLTARVRSHSSSVQPRKPFGGLLSRDSVETLNDRTNLWYRYTACCRHRT
jgi:hypothetical protein